MRRVFRAIIVEVYRRVHVLQTVYRPLRKAISIIRLKRQLRQRYAEKNSIRLFLGANRKYQPGWIPTEIYNLNILRPHDWERYFSESSVDAMVAEHVWEHLTKEEGVLAAQLCHRYLRPGGYLRVAVPDGWFPDPNYIEFVKPGGRGPSAYDHKVLYTYRTLTEVFERAGFKVVLLEYFDEKGQFHYEQWDPEDGLITRSMRFYEGRQFGSLKYRSLILEAQK